MPFPFLDTCNITKNAAYFSLGTIHYDIIVNAAYPFSTDRQHHLRKIPILLRDTSDIIDTAAYPFFRDQQHHWERCLSLYEILVTSLIMQPILFSRDEHHHTAPSGYYPIHTNKVDIEILPAVLLIHDKITDLPVGCSSDRTKLDQQACSLKVNH